MAVLCELNPALLVSGLALPLLDGTHEGGFRVPVSGFVLHASSLLADVLLEALLFELLRCEPLSLHHTLKQEHNMLSLGREELHLFSRELLDLLEELDVVLRHHRDRTT